MPRLYIANCTRQNQNIYYRLDFNTGGDAVQDRRFIFPKSQLFAAGRQAVLGSDSMHINQINDIVEQLKPYGLIGKDDLSEMRGKTPYVFSIDTPVPALAMQRVMDHNDGVMVKDGKERRAKTAVVANETVANQIDTLNKFEVEVEQEEQSEAGESRIEEGYRVERGAPEQPPPVRGKRQRKAA